MLFSIIIPVYNVENYLGKCVDSVLAQGETDYEAILIDDGSTDRSASICNHYAESNPNRIRVIHQENKGLGGARNTGLNAAKGDYVLFLDSDDYLEQDTLETLRSAFEGCDCDLVLFDFLIEWEGEAGVYKAPEVPYPIGKPFSPQDYPEILLVKNVCRIACKRAVLEEHVFRFVQREWFEDIRFAPVVLAVSEQIIAIQKPLYHYVQRSGSIMHNTNVSRNIELLNAFDDLRHQLLRENKYEQYEHQVCQLGIEEIILAAIPRIIYQDLHHPLLNQFVDYMETVFPEYWKHPAANETLQRKLFVRLSHARRFDLINALLATRRLLRKTIAIVRG